MPPTPYTLEEVAAALAVPLGPLLRILELHRENAALKAQKEPSDADAPDGD